MKTLLFVERLRPDGTIRKWAALAAAALISCSPVASAFADNHGGGGHGGGGHGGGGGHPSGGGGHGGGGHPRDGGHGGGGVHVSGGGAPHFVSGGQNGGGGHGGGGGRFSAARPAPMRHSGGNNHFSANGASHQAGGHQNRAFSSKKGNNFAAHNQSNRTGEHRAIAQEKHQNNRVTKNNRVTNRTIVHQNNSQRNSFAETRKIVHQNNGEQLKTRALLMNRTGSFDRSITRGRVQGLMNNRLNQIANRRWTGRGQFYANHFDPGNHCWYHHGGYWWRCNYWGAHAYCNRLIGLGFAPGLCWGWYDNICWGNIVVGMPFDLVAYYYPDPVYTAYTTYDGDEATVYYYALDDGQYKRVTVVDGNVVDVQIVSEIV